MLARPRLYKLDWQGEGHVKVWVVGTRAGMGRKMVRVSHFHILFCDILGSINTFI